MTEMATPKWRHWANCLSQVANGVGIAVQALIAFFIRDWKTFSLVINAFERAASSLLLVSNK